MDLCYRKFTDPVRARQAFFLRIRGAGRVPDRTHIDGEWIVVLEGNFIDDDGTEYGVGEICLAEAGSIC